MPSLAHQAELVRYNLHHNKVDYRLYNMALYDKVSTVSFANYDSSSGGGTTNTGGTAMKPVATGAGPLSNLLTIAVPLDLLVREGGHFGRRPISVLKMDVEELEQASDDLCAMTIDYGYHLVVAHTYACMRDNTAQQYGSAACDHGYTCVLMPRTTPHQIERECPSTYIINAAATASYHVLVIRRVAGSWLA